jgi:hypothetical protein
MNKAMGGQTNVSHLVVKHIEEVEALENRFQEKIASLKK